MEVGVRPEHLLPFAAPSLQGDSPLAGTVMLVEHLGESNLLHLQLDDGSELVMRGDGNQAVRLGERLLAHVDMAQLHVFRGNGLACRRLVPGNMQLSRHAAGALQ